MSALAVNPVMPQHLELWPIERLRPYTRNARTHSEEQIAQVAASIKEFGWTNPVLVAEDGTVVAGHGRLLAARKLGLAAVPVVVLDHLSETQRRAYIIADNKLALNAGWDEKVLAAELRELESEGVDLSLVGFSDDELADLRADDEPQSASDAEEQMPEAPAQPVTGAGDVWQIGKHRLVCGDCRDLAVVKRLLDPGKKDARQVAVAITSPPYATQREYDPSSGFRPIPPEEYVAWYADVAANVAAMLAPDGSYFLNIKEHADDGERSLYVKDLVLAHRRQWGWRFVDEFCWRKTDNGVPGGWNNRFKNAWEPVFHFCREQQIKFRPRRVGHESADCFDYSPANPKSSSGSGLLGTGPRGSAAANAEASDGAGRYIGVARPSNVIEVKSESSQGSHSAPYPRALVEFFLLAFSDPGDLIFDPFMGSGTTMAAAHLLDRVGCGCELSPAYCDVILYRMMNLTGTMPFLADTGDGLPAVAAARGISTEQLPEIRGADRRHKENGTPVFVKSDRI